jgi:hypothetical protein
MQGFPTEGRFLNLEWLFMQTYRGTVRIFGTDSVTFARVLEFFKALFIILIIITLAILIYFLVRMYELQQEDKPKKEKKIKAATEGAVVAGVTGVAAVALAPKINETWERIRQNGYSEEESRWRLAIIEADIYMDKLLDQKGYVGETVSDKLKQLSENQLSSIQYAWEAHKVRNKIAHEGADFVLTFPETRRVLLLYEVVFRELGALS